MPVNIEAQLAECEAARVRADHAAGLALARRIVEQPGLTPLQQARARALLALHALRVGDVETCVRGGLPALPLLEQAGERGALSRLHSTLALAYHEGQLHPQALHHAAAALRGAREAGDRHAECWALSRAAIVYEGQGEQAQCLDYARRSLALAHTLGDAELLFAALNNLASTLTAVAVEGGAGAAPLLDEALAHAREAVAVAGSQPGGHREALAHHNLGTALMRQGHHGEARAALACAHGMAQARGYRRLAVMAATSLAELAQAEGHGDEALQRAQALLVGLDPQRDRAEALPLHTLLYGLHKARGEFEPALRHHERLHQVQMQQVRDVASLQSRLLMDQLALDDARHQAMQARHDAQLQRLRAEALDHAAHTDALTGLPNRRALERQLPPLMQRARAQGLPLAAALVDIDHFKRVNDRHGHPVGDRVLAELAGLLQQATRGTDVAVRLGGEEFLLVLVDAPLALAEQACERLRAAVQAHPWGQLAPGLACTASLGVAGLRPDEAPADWLKRADEALYEAKRAGRNRVVAAA